MNIWIVTIKLPKNPNHDPRNKRTDRCEMSEVCTDSTGEHHSFIRVGDLDEIKLKLKQEGFHITRIEYAGMLGEN